MFVPSIGLTLLGVWLDGKWQTKPWLMMSGIALGVVFAFALVRQQLRRLKPTKGTK
jgi:F0F1-type ATP synthase assembly protein I